MTERTPWAVIMAGGGGTRLWPASRQAKPKQLLTLQGDRSLLQNTKARLDGLVAPEHTLVVTGASVADLVREQLPDLPEENVLAEPMGRNTLPCVAWAASEIQKRDPDSVHMVLPADHVIEPVESFRDTLRAGLAAACADPEPLVTLGIRPTYPATGFGYIQTGDSAGDFLGHEALMVQRFVEKPDRERAEEFVRAGTFLWNSGAFLWSTRAIASALAKHAPATWQALEGKDPAQVSAAYPELAAESVDVGLMEKAANIQVLPIGYFWSDVGSWPAMEEIWEPDGNGNRAGGGARVVSEDSSGNLVHGNPDHTIALLGVKDVIIVQTPDATLVASKQHGEGVRRIVDRLKGEAPGLL